MTEMRKSIYYYITAVLMLLSSVPSCRKGSGPYDPVGGEPLRIEASTDEVSLEGRDNDETAVTFRWTEGYEYPDVVKVTYCFKIDIADNDFASATELEVLGSDVFEKSFSVGELNDLCLEHWNITPGESVMLEAKVIGRLTADKFIMPEVATTTLLVKTYKLQSTPLYILGSALSANGGSWEPRKAIPMTEEVLSRQYSYKGKFAAGEYIFPESRETRLPAWFKGEDSSTMEYHKTDEGTCFSVSRAATYKVVVNTRAKTHRMIYYPEYEHIYMVGAASPGGWEITDAFELSWIEGTSQFVYEGYLKAGEFKFAAGERSWSAPFFMPPSDNLNDLTIGTMQLVQPGGVDYKWVITEANAGKWRIRLDTDALTIKFEKL